MVSHVYFLECKALRICFDVQGNGRRGQGTSCLEASVQHHRDYDLQRVPVYFEVRTLSTPAVMITFWNALTVIVRIRLRASMAAHLC